MPEDTQENALFTGETFLDSLRDGREVWFDGERVDVCTQTKTDERRLCGQ
ncbi:MAG: hypothetical protein QF435_03025 [Arenicellales bacterium]|nr:hypothetical protein [Arenicellales bacterium]